MIRIDEEQGMILSCYSGTRAEVILQLTRAIPLIEDAELREMSENLLVNIGKMDDDEFAELSAESIMGDDYDGLESGDAE